MKITIKQYGKTFSKNNIEVENEVIKKTKKFNWYFNYNNKVNAKEYDKLNSIKKQIRNQFDCSQRTLIFNIEL
jgi:hypothetical protein